MTITALPLDTTLHTDFDVEIIDAFRKDKSPAEFETALYQLSDKHYVHIDELKDTSYRQGRFVVCLTDGSLPAIVVNAANNDLKRYFEVKV